MTQHSIFNRPLSFSAALPLAAVACWALLAGIRLGLVISDGFMMLPGPGLWPCLAGIGLLFWTAALCLPLDRNAQRPVRHPLLPPRSDERKRHTLSTSLTGLALACPAWLCLTPLLGWFGATAAALYLAARTAGNHWKTSALMAVIFPVLLYFSIVRGLGWPLPEGLIWSLS